MSVEHFEDGALIERIKNLLTTQEFEMFTKWHCGDYSAAMLAVEHFGTSKSDISHKLSRILSKIRRRLGS